ERFRINLHAPDVDGVGRPPLEIDGITTWRPVEIREAYRLVLDSRLHVRCQFRSHRTPAVGQHRPEGRPVTFVISVNRYAPTIGMPCGLERAELTEKVRQDAMKIGPIRANHIELCRIRRVAEEQRAAMRRPPRLEAEIREPVF